MALAHVLSYIEDSSPTDANTQVLLVLARYRTLNQILYLLILLLQSMRF